VEKSGGFDCVVGTSGTILALGALALQLDGGAPRGLHHATVPVDAIQSVRRWLVTTSLRARREQPALAGRADTIVSGSILLGALLRRLRATELVLCEWALREGILLDYIQGHARSLARAEAYPDVRRRSVMALAERCQYDQRHARHVAALAVSLFDQTRRRHRLGARERSLLEYAALLHDIGHHISYPGHHKHTYYLIKNGDLRGFEPREVEVLANVARYHRRGRPRKRHAALRALPRAARRLVKVLAAHLRLADALDRSHHQVVRSLSVGERSGRWRVVCRIEGDGELELWGGERRKALLERVLGAPVRLLPARETRVPRAPRARADG
jgi:exopolyphosphatase/guanosine-5'-triphosphate,3'-diphosphate pyrophosphatase